MGAPTPKAAAADTGPPITRSLRRPAIVCGVTVFALSFSLYLFTLAPTVTPVDSGELITAARTLGVAHPPGFPLYVLLAHFASLLPFGSVAFRVNLASALFAALAASVLSLSVLEVIMCFGEQRSRRPVPKSKKRKEPAVTELHRGSLSFWEGTAPALAAGLLFSCSRTLWAYATVTEVYTLNSLMVALIILFMLHWRRLALREPAELSSSNRGGKRDKHIRWLYAAAFTFGLALGVHHVTVGLVLPAFAVIVLATEGRRFFTGRKLPLATAFALAGLCIYAYLPLAASHAPVMNWGDPRTLDRFVAHVTGWQYRVFFEAKPEQMGRELGDFFMRVAREFGPVWLPLALALAVAGFAYLHRHTRAIFWFLATTVLANLAYNVNYEIAEDKDAYYLPVFMALVMASAFGTRLMIEWLSQKSRHGSRLHLAAATVLLVALPGVSCAANFRFDNRREYYIARDYAENIMSTVGPEGMLLTMDWEVYSPMFYLREIEAFRRDAVVIDINQLRRSWYFAYLERAYPETMSRVRGEAALFLEDLRHWERDPETYQRDIGLNERISSRFRNLILALIANHPRSAPVYVTQDIAIYPEAGPDFDWTRRIAQNYQLVPQGLVFQLFSDRGFHEPVRPRLATRSLVGAASHFSADDVVRIKIVPVYAGMAYNRGRYLAAAGRNAEAIQAFREALDFDPQFAPAQNALATLQ